MTIAYIGLGSNLETPLEQIRRAIKTLIEHPSLKNVSVSNIYASKPVGPQDQPDYVNAVACFETDLTGIALLDLLQSIEQDQLISETWIKPSTPGAISTKAP